jgi:hypothetical protein
MAIDVGLFPKNAAAAEWLQHHFEELRLAFEEIHRSGDSTLSGYHPHGLSLETRPSSDLPSVSVYVGAHWSKAHADRTVTDLRKALQAVGAETGDFVIEHTAEV